MTRPVVLRCRGDVFGMNISQVVRTGTTAEPVHPSNELLPAIVPFRSHARRASSHRSGVLMQLAAEH
jgi:hypothetical protein